MRQDRREIPHTPLVGRGVVEDGILDEDAFLLLHEQFMPKNPNFSYEEYDRFSLDEMNDAECLAEFRFRKHDLQILTEVLQMLSKKCC